MISFSYTLETDNLRRGLEVWGRVWGQSLESGSEFGRGGEGGEGGEQPKHEP